MSIALSLEACAYRSVAASPPSDDQLQLIAARAKQARQAINQTQAQVARALGIAEMTISRYERGKYVPDSSIATRLAAHYGVSVDWLLGSDPTARVNVESRVEQDEGVLRAVEEFIASLDADELAEFREHDEQWASGLAFKDLRSTLGIDVTASLIRRLWSERRGQRAGKLRPPPTVPVAVPPDRIKLPRVGKKR
jgi:transcriptional regulator with XRE-family HTH domain